MILFRYTWAGTCPGVLVETTAVSPWTECSKGQTYYNKFATLVKLSHQLVFPHPKVGNNMVTAEEMRPVPATPMVDLREVPLTEILALGPEVIYGAIGRALPGRTAATMPTTAGFQSAI
jgi:FXSXX-COOH protein